MGLHPREISDNMEVATVEQNYAVAIQQETGDSTTTGFAVIRRRQILVVSTSDPEDVRYSMGNIAAFIFALAISVTYGAMMILGAVHYHDCSDTRMALYTVVQGIFAMFNTAMFAVWIMWRCVSYKPICTIGLLIFLFNLAWCIVGVVWIAQSPCRGTSLYSYSVGFSIPMWFVLFLVCCNFCCCQNNN